MSDFLLRCAVLAPSPIDLIGLGGRGDFVHGVDQPVGAKPIFQMLPRMAIQQFAGTVWLRRRYKPSSDQIASMRACTAASMRIGRPHSRVVSPGHLWVASKPTFEPRPETGEAKSR